VGPAFLRAEIRDHPMPPTSLLRVLTRCALTSEIADVTPDVFPANVSARTTTPAGEPAVAKPLMQHRGMGPLITAALVAQIGDGRYSGAG
jgi:hypothetical protein